MRRLLFALVLLGSLSCGAALPVVHETCVGDVRIVCADPASWTFEAAAKTADDVSEVTVRLMAPSPSAPPTFDVVFETSGVGADHTWTPLADGIEPNQIWPTEWGHGKPRYASQLANGSPLATVYRVGGENTLTIACSEAFRRVEYAPTIGASDCRLTGRFRFFTTPESAMTNDVVTIRIDRRRKPWSDCVIEASDWIVTKNGFAPCPVPESAYDPVYSSWYAFWQDVHAEDLETEARLASELGMKTMILDDGWQKETSRTYYSATGDWQPVAKRFPDMAAHVDRVHQEGLKYLLWISLPFVGDESAAWSRFKDKFLYLPFLDGGGMGVLDPRFPEVREYIVSTCERAVRDWGFDGLKVDFVDWFMLDPDFPYAHIAGDPAEKDDFRGRDIRSLPVAVDVLMKELTRRVRAVRSEALIEFRQHYMGPAIRQYGNMIRATDCPADSDKIRRLVADLRLTSGTTPVHSDMLVWSPDETPERAARPILNSLFSVIQYSMVLKRLPSAHREVIRHWLAFSQEHRETLLKSSFRPHHPEQNYTWLEAESDRERIVGVYADGQRLAITAEKPQIVINATEAPELVLDLVAPMQAVVRDVFGRLVRTMALESGLQKLAVPCSGLVELAPVPTHWWGATTFYGNEQPYETTPRRDLAEFSYCNPTAPLLLSDQGDFIWSDKPFAFAFTNGVPLIEARGKLIRCRAGTTLREAYLAAVQDCFPPSGRRPDDDFFVKPQFNTWVESCLIGNGERMVADYANGIVSNRFPCGVLMIDDGWAPKDAYGDLRFDEKLFPHAKSLFADLRAKGFRILLWTTPYIYATSDFFKTCGKTELFLQDRANGRRDTYCYYEGVPACGLLDLYNPMTWDSLERRYKAFMEEYGFDGYKFDFTDAECLRRQVVKGEPIPEGRYPCEYTEAWGHFAERFPYHELRAGYRFGGRPLVVRLQDKCHSWEDLRLLIPDMIAAGIQGCPFTCPDMIGGGTAAGGFREGVDRKLFVRSAQVQALMPMMQFSVAPWRALDDEALAACRAAAELHVAEAQRILRLADEAARTGEPIVRALEYVFPHQGLFNCQTQFMLGDDLLVAPVLSSDDSVTVRLPKGLWRDDLGSDHYGPAELRLKNVPLNRLPRYERLRSVSYLSKVPDSEEPGCYNLKKVQ